MVRIIYMFDVLTDIFRDACVGFMVSSGKVDSGLHDRRRVYLIITIIILRVRVRIY